MLGAGNTMVNKTRYRLTLMEHLSSEETKHIFAKRFGVRSKAQKTIKQKNRMLVKESKEVSLR